MAVPDRANWKVAWICCFISFVLLGVSRLGGLFFVVVIEDYNVSRSEASLPFVLCYTVRNVAGPLIGFLTRKIGLKKVCLIGCIMSAVGIGLCFFAQNLLTVTILWGGVFGFGLGLGTVLIPEILRQHFTNHIAKANGIAFGGECLAGFVLPALLDVSLRTYGSQGTFLILSGLILNSIPAVLLLEKPSQKQHVKNQYLNNSYSSEIRQENISVSVEDFSDPKTCYNIKRSSTVESILKDIDIKAKRRSSDYQQVLTDKITDSSELSKHLVNNTVSANNEAFHQIAIPVEKSKLFVLTTEHELKSETNLEFNASYNITRSSLKHSKSLENFNTQILSGENLYQSCKKLYHSDRLPCNTINNGNYLPNHERSVLDEESQKKESSNCSAIGSFAVFLDMTFILILLIQSSFIYIVTTVLTIVVDYSKDIGVADHEQIYIVMGMSIADMAGRFCLGFITDSGLITETVFSSVGFAVMGLLLLSSLYLRGFVLLMIVMFLFGLLIGGLLIVFPGIVAEFIEEDKITMALASRLSLYGPLSLTQSSLIGYFRGILGSYDGVFYILVFLCFTCSVLTVLTPIVASRRKI